MGNAIAWLNANQGFALTILTLVYVLATCVLAYFARRANSLGAKQLEQAIELERRRSRPYVTFDFEAHESSVDAVIRNIGQAPALGITFSIDPVPLRPDDKSGMVPLSFVGIDLRLLAPGGRLSEWMSRPERFKEQYEETEFTGELSYRDIEGREYREQFAVTCPNPGRTFHVPGGEIASELRSIAWTLENTRMG